MPKIGDIKVNLEVVAAELEQLRAEREELIELRAKLAAIEAKEPPLLQCVDCRNTESCAGAMARHFNRGRCLHCGGYFRVVRA